MAVGPTSMIVIAVVALIIFGPKKLPQFGRAMGSTLKEFKDATKGLATDDDDEEELERKKQPKKIEAVEVEKAEETKV
ncbi:twin-arginine translocase TatA/TatE family subunit [Salinicoccus roseus]|uniref:twin-arginine translocase TatA/TatE family subunit n=2 Tax=Salinicoccus TaxID=45669 RepID=UPI001E2B2067|nr:MULTISPECIES: twin-arginine translocase TatA/TatE family subunit [Salinicoccus]MCC4723182.1 twin-arginine translocase TatA/TatE family subunit [Salinicoccus sp. RF5]MCG7333599.1 twin-arginine translocase TatA/TatE family subunit [Salinicoccus roseus]